MHLNYEHNVVEPRYLATFHPGQIFGERRGWQLNEGSVITKHVITQNTTGQALMPVHGRRPNTRN